MIHVRRFAAAWIRGSTFGMRESLAGAVTSLFFALTIDEQTLYFHGYYDVSDNSSAETMHVAIVARRAAPFGFVIDETWHAAMRGPPSFAGWRGRAA
ncbi:DUF1419 domain-containing protein [Ensifer aridi]|uniref:DUF1419 domain-containing protein n=1 Tax=Ensifer aridi TaxID=1708715 RepID=UPI0023B9D644|nr:DUF1419 domain-containing protein [Ensifer aridi]